MSVKRNKQLGYLSSYVGEAVEPFDQIFTGRTINILRDGFEGVDAIVLWGGTDIHPSFYNEKAHKNNQVASMPNPSTRDLNEWKAMVYAKAHGIPIIGVCRGAQFLCAFAGGRLIQHVGSHGSGTHDVTCKTNDKEEVMRVTTCHHQMMYPFDVPHEMLAYSEPLSSMYEVGPGAPPVDMAGKVEPEVVYFPYVRGFAVQGHPEWMHGESPFVSWMNASITEKFFEQVETV